MDWNTPIKRAKDILGEKYVLQGNLEPCRIYNKDSMLKGAKEILDTMENKGHIFNLGHGVLPDLPKENIQELVKFIHNYKG